MRRYGPAEVTAPKQTAMLALVLAAMTPAAAAAQSPTVVGPYDGEIPFNCTLQNVGTGTDFPEPDVDPFCVEFDKTSQNVTDFGIVDFTAQEPARVAAAGDKCFYFQRDHWTGSITPAASTAAGLRFGLRPPRSQGQEPEIWHWDGNYFYDRARGVGGVSVRNFRLGGTPQSAGAFVPPGYEPYFDENGGGGVEVLLESDPDPTCAVKVDTPEERDQVYGNRPAQQQCIEPGGGIRGRKVGRVKLGNKRDAVRAKLGPPTYGKRGFDAWCLVGKGELRVAYGNGRARMVVTSGSGQSLHGVSRGDRRERALRLLRLGRQPATAGGGVRIFAVRGKRPPTLVAISRNRVRWLLVGSADARGLGPSAFRKLTRHMP
jgi:hypothetical protein